jgi:hypothetical protein
MYIEKYNLLFIHIPKTAGTSISQYLNFLDSDEFKEKYGKSLPLNFTNPRWVTGYGHLPLKYYNQILTEDVVKNSIKFTVIRNPISRLKSLYYYSVINDRVDIPVNKFLPQLYKEINFILDRGYCIDYDNLNGCDSMFNTLRVMRQVDFFNQDDDVNLIKLENLQNDFDRFTLKYKLPKFKIPVTNISNNVDARLFLKEICQGHPAYMKNFLFDYYKKDYDLWTSLKKITATITPLTAYYKNYKHKNRR